MSLSHLECTADSPPLPIESLGLPCSVEFSHAGGSECHIELGLLEHVSWEDFCLGIRQVGAWLCGYTGVGALLSSLRAQLELSWGGKVPADFRALLPKGNYLDLPFQALDTPPF